MNSQSSPDAPVSCSLSAAGAAGQLSSWAALRSRCVRAERAAGRAAAWFEPAAEGALRAVAEREAACCPFLQLSVQRDGDLVRLDIASGASGAQEVIELLVAQVSGT